MSVEALTVMRQEWDEGERALRAERGDRRRYRRLVEQIDVVTDELRRRTGQTYTLADLAAAYRDGESWARPAVEERATSPDWSRDLALVLAAAFYGYQRGAVDYAP